MKEDVLAAGANYEVTWCNVGTNGCVSDGGVWNRSCFGQALETSVRDLNFPPPEPLPHRTRECPYVIIGDDAFALKSHFHNRILTSKVTSVITVFQEHE